MEAVKIYLSENQQDKIKNAFKNGQEVTLQIKHQPPNYTLKLTKTQINRINNGKRITLSVNQVKQHGGFLPFLMPLLGALATGVASGAAGWGTRKALNKISGSGCQCKKKTGKGMYQNWQ